jgi:hypothetical protein
MTPAYAWQTDIRRSQTAAVTSPTTALADRVVQAAEGYADASDCLRAERFGYVLGLLDAGVIARYWQKRQADSAAELARHRYKLGTLPDILFRRQEIEVLTMSAVARFLGASPQRIDQLLRSPE